MRSGHRVLSGVLASRNEADRGVPAKGGLGLLHNFAARREGVKTADTGTGCELI